MGVYPMVVNKHQLSALITKFVDACEFGMRCSTYASSMFLNHPTNTVTKSYDQKDPACVNLVSEMAFAIKGVSEQGTLAKSKALGNCRIEKYNADYENKWNGVGVSLKQSSAQTTNDLLREYSLGNQNESLQHLNSNNPSERSAA